MFQALHPDAGNQLHDERALHHAILRLTGRDPVEYLMKILAEQGYSLTATAKRDIARNVREKLCYSGFDNDTQLKSTAEVDKEKTHVFPNRNIISVDVERFHCAEVPFQPSFTGMEVRGFRDTSFQNVMKCDVNIRKSLYANAVLSSGTNMFQGMVERMTNELTALAPSMMRSRRMLHLTETSSLSTLNVSIPLKCHSSQVSLRKKKPAFHNTCVQSNTKCDVHIRKELYANTVLPNGTTMFQVIIERTTKGLTALLHPR